MLDSMSAYSAPAFAGRVWGRGRGGRAGEGLGDKCELQDMMFHWFMALGIKVGMRWTWLGLCCSRVLWGAWGEVALSTGCVGFRVSGGTRREGKGSKFGGCHAM